MATLAEIDSGTESTTGSEDTLVTHAEPGVYALATDLSALGSGDTVTLRGYRKVLSGGSLVLAYKETFTGEQDPPSRDSVAIASAHEIQFTAEWSDGTPDDLPWSLVGIET